MTERETITQIKNILPLAVRGEENHNLGSLLGSITGRDVAQLDSCEARNSLLGCLMRHLEWAVCDCKMEERKCGYVLSTVERWIDEICVLPGSQGKVDIGNNLFVGLFSYLGNGIAENRGKEPRGIFNLVLMVCERIVKRKANRKKVDLEWTGGEEAQQNAVVFYQFIHWFGGFIETYLNDQNLDSSASGSAVEAVVTSAQDDLRAGIKTALVCMKVLGHIDIREYCERRWRESGSISAKAKDEPLFVGVGKFFRVCEEVLCGEAFSRECMGMTAMLYGSIVLLLPDSQTVVFAALRHVVGRQATGELFVGGNGRQKERLVMCDDMEGRICLMFGLDSFEHRPYPLYSKLALVKAWITNLSDEMLHSDFAFRGINESNCRHLGIEVFIRYLYDQMDEPHDPNFRYVLFSTIETYFERAAKALEADPHREQLSRHFRIASSFVQEVTDRVMMTWDDPVTGVSLQTRQIFAHFEKLLVLCNDPGKVKRFLQTLVENFSMLDWHVKGKYGVSALIVPYLGYQAYFQCNKKLVFELESCFTVTNLRRASASLYEQLVKDIAKTEKKGTREGVWDGMFGDMLVRGLSNSDELFRKRVVTYWLDTTLAVLPGSLEHIYRRINTEPSFEKRMCQQVLLFRGMRALGLMNRTGEIIGKARDGCSKELKIEVEEPLYRCVRNSDENIRLEALAFNCISKLSSERVLSCEMEFIKCHLPLNMSSSSKEFRQHLCEHIRKFVYRIYESILVTSRLIKKSKTKGKGSNIGEVAAKGDIMIREYCEFIQWLWGFALRSACTDSSYQRKVTALDILRSVCAVFMEEVEGKSNKTYYDLQECFAEKSYEFGISGEKSLGILISALNCTFTEVREHVCDIISKYFAGSSTARLWTRELCVSVSKFAFKKMSSPRAHSSAIGASFLKVLFTVVCLGQKRDIPVFSFSGRELHSEGPCVVISTVKKVLDLLECELNLCRENLIDGFSKAPIHGALHCLADVIEMINFADFSQTNETLQNEWKILINNILAISEEVVTFVSSILISGTADQSSKWEISDMSDLPSFADVEYLIEEAVVEQQNEKGNLKYKRQLVTVCGWLVFKEVCGLLGSLGEALPETHERGDNCILFLNPRQYVGMGETLISVIMKSRHRGTIEAANAAFGKVCRRCFVSRSEMLSKFPRNQVYLIIEELSKSSRMASVTRRSAGIPYVVETILSAGCRRANADLLRQCMTGLFELAEETVPRNYDETIDLPQVHALNILRVIFKNSNLGNEMLQYSPQGLEIALRQISSESWAVRNGATMLYGAVVERIVGAKQHEDENAAFNGVAVEDVFSRYPSVLEILCEHLDTNKSSLYPTVVMMSKFLSNGSQVFQDEGERNRFEGIRSRIFENLRHTCLVSSIFQVRIMSARALLPFTPIRNRESALFSILNEFKNVAANGNVAHGMLLYIDTLLRDIVAKSPSLATGHTHVFEWVFACAEEMLKISGRTEFASNCVFVQICTDFCFGANFTLLAKDTSVSARYRKEIVNMVVLLKGVVEHPEKVPVVPYSSLFVQKCVFLLLKIILNKSLTEFVEVPMVVFDCHLARTLMHSSAPDVANGFAKFVKVYCGTPVDYYRDVDKSGMSLFNEGSCFQVEHVITSFGNMHIQDLLGVLNEGLIVHRELITLQHILDAIVCLVSMGGQNLPNVVLLGQGSVVLKKAMSLIEYKRNGHFIKSFLPYLGVLLSTESAGPEPLRIFVEMLEEFSHPNNEASFRESAVEAIKQAGESILLADSVTGDVRFSTLLVFARLLQDEDDLIRNNMANVVSAALPEHAFINDIENARRDDGFQVHPGVCLERVFKHMILGMFLPKSSEESFEEAIKFMTTIACEENCSENTFLEERLTKRMDGSHSVPQLMDEDSQGAEHNADKELFVIERTNIFYESFLDVQLTLYWSFVALKHLIKQKDEKTNAIMRNALCKYTHKVCKNVNIYQNKEEFENSTHLCGQLLCLLVLTSTPLTNTDCCRAHLRDLLHSIESRDHHCGKVIEQLPFTELKRSISEEKEEKRGFILSPYL
eukprot:Nk52_evm58s224 gene=Nk52_evmTU58s224